MSSKGASPHDRGSGSVPPGPISPRAIVPIAGDAQTPSLLGKELGPYRLEALLGQGGMARVYRARNRTTGGVVAIKVLEGPTHQHGFRERFEREWQVMQGITHPNVVSVLDWPSQTKKGPLYYAMELLQGETLAQRLEREERLPLDAALDVFEQLAEGVTAVHASRSIHRDIKPQNIFLAESADGKITVKLLDFGLARVFGSQITGAGIIVGTPAYVSPEQASGDVVDHRADIYGVGLVMYRALTGQHPFSSDDQVATLGHQILSPPPPLSWLEESVPPELEALVLKMLRKLPADRPQSFTDVRAQLRTIRREIREREAEAALSSVPRESLAPEARPSNPPDDRYGPLNPLAESLVNNALLAKGFRRPRS